MSGTGPTDLTPLEHEMLLLAEQARSAAEIAARLGISEESVERLLERLFQKLAARESQ